MPGPSVRTDVVDVYVFRRTGGGLEFLQLLRADGEHGGRLARTWQPLMGHVDEGETADVTAWRELREEVGLVRTDPALRGLWALNQVHPFYIVARDQIVMSPRFAAEVDPAWAPTLNEEHTDWRWVTSSDASAAFMWPGQAMAIDEIERYIARDGWAGDAVSRLF